MLWLESFGFILDDNFCLAFIELIQAVRQFGVGCLQLLVQFFRPFGLFCFLLSFFFCLDRSLQALDATCDGLCVGHDYHQIVLEVDLITAVGKSDDLVTLVTNFSLYGSVRKATRAIISTANKRNFTLILSCMAADKGGSAAFVKSHDWIARKLSMI
jgi:hypothetical protein